MTIDYSKQCMTVLSEVVAEIIRSQLVSDTSTFGQIIRVNFLRDEEILNFLETWNGVKDEFNLSEIKLIISSNPENKFPSEFVASTPITYYRNNNENGLIYLENEITSDSQSLKNAFTIRDTDVLNGVVRLDSFPSPVELIVHKAWHVVTSGASTPSDLVVETLTKIFRLFSSDNRRIALRQFIEFAVRVAAARENISSALSLEDTYKMIGNCLVSLELFPDQMWMSDTSEAKVSRRLFLNSEYAELYQKGQPLDIDDLIERIKTFEFRNEHGELFSAEVQSELRVACVKYCDTKTNIENVPFYIFEQLFKTDTVGLKLGEKVEAELVELAPERLNEYMMLGVKDGLDAKIADEAQRFLDAEPDDSTDPLRNLITTATKRRIEKAAAPSAKSVNNPFLAIAKVCELFHGREDQDNQTENKYLKLTAVQNADNEFTTFRLFKFLYANSLSELVDLRSNNLDGFGFKVDEMCKDYDPSDTLERVSQYRDGEIEEDLPWSPVLLKFELFVVKQDGQDELIENDLTFQWYPENLNSIATYWFHTLEQNAEEQLSKLELPSEFDFDRYSELVANGTVGTSVLKRTALNVLGGAIYNEAYTQILNCTHEIAQNGLAVSTLRTCLDHWDFLSRELRKNHVPNGDVVPVLDDYLTIFLLHNTAKGIAVMTPGHPLKQRWIAEYLNKSIEFSEMSLTGEINLNAENPNFYIDWIFNTAPLQQPALVYGANKRLLFSAKEHHWFETYTDVERDFSSANNIDHNIVEIATKEIVQYLQAYPHKADGLSILIAITDSPQFPTRVVNALRTKEWRSLKVDLHVVADKNIWGNVRNEFEKLNVADRLSSGGDIHPDTHLHLYELSEEAFSSIELNELRVDISIRPQFFSERPQIEEETRMPSDEMARFNPLLDRPTKIDVIASGNKVSVEQLPATSDTFSENWSTIAVRQKRLRAFAPDNLENTDLVKLNSDFERETKLLNLLHKVSHWVITVEKNISRQYIESLEEKPEILAIKENLGASNLHTMIISSNSGQDFSKKRLSRKIQRTFKIDQEQSNNLASQVFDESKSLAPSLALQAMGISRITEEMLGLIIAKKLADYFQPAKVMNGFSAWISLDTHTDWFGGTASTRADLCRLDFDYGSEEQLSVSATIVEAKFRQSLTNYGLSQIEQTMKLFDNFLPAEVNKIDAELWRNNILDAVDNCSPDAVMFYGEIADSVALNGGKIIQSIREDFRNGNYELKSLIGFYSQAIYGEEGNFKKNLLPSGERHLYEITSYANQLTEILTGAFPTSEPPLPNETESLAGVADPLPADEHTAAETSENTTVVQEDNVTHHAPQISYEAFDFRRLSNEHLLQRYQTIIDALGEHNISVKPVAPNEEPYFEGPATIVFRLNLGAGVDPRAIFAKSDILKLKLGLGEEQSIRAFIDSGNIVIEVPKSSSERYFVEAEQLWSRWNKPDDHLACPIGVDQRGNVVDFIFSSSNSPHLLIGGTTGSGKSEALNTILAGLTHFYPPELLRLNLVDPKGTELQTYEHSPHLEQEIVEIDDEAIEMLERMVDEMNRRYTILKSKRVNNILRYNSLVADEDKMPWHIVVLDEYADLTSDQDAKRNIEKHLKRLAQKARAAGIHVIIATQKPSAEVISTNLRSNLPAQLALRVKESRESIVIMAEKGAETLNGKGDAFLNADGKIRRIQCGYIPQ